MAKYEVYDHYDEVVDECDSLIDAQISAEHESAKFVLDTDTNKIVWAELTEAL